MGIRYFDIINEKFGTKANVNPSPSTIIGTSNISENNVQSENDLASTIVGTSNNNANDVDVWTNKKKKIKSSHDSCMQGFINLKKEEMAKVEEKQKKLLDVKKQEVAGLEIINDTSTCLNDRFSC